MSIQFRCHHCNKRVQAPESAGGKKAKCPVCGQETEVPSIKPDDEPLSGFAADFVAANTTQRTNPPGPPPREEPQNYYPEFTIRQESPVATDVHRRVHRTRQQVVIHACKIALIALYVIALMSVPLRLLDESDRAIHSNPAEYVVGTLLGPPVFLGFVLAYFAPSILAYIREHQNAVPIFIINAVFGWTLLGWVGSLAWAFSSDVKETRQYVRHVIVKETHDAEP